MSSRKALTSFLLILDHLELPFRSFASLCGYVLFKWRPLRFCISLVLIEVTSEELLGTFFCTERITDSRIEVYEPSSIHPSKCLFVDSYCSRLF